MKQRKEEVDVSVHIMHWGHNTNQVSASKWELSHSAKITISVMQSNMVNRARDGVKRKKECLFEVCLQELDVFIKGGYFCSSFKTLDRGNFLSKSDFLSINTFTAIDRHLPKYSFLRGECCQSKPISIFPQNLRLFLDSHLNNFVADCTTLPLNALVYHHPQLIAQSWPLPDLTAFWHPNLSIKKKKKNTYIFFYLKRKPLEALVWHLGSQKTQPQTSWRIHFRPDTCTKLMWMFHLAYSAQSNWL